MRFMTGYVVALIFGSLCYTSLLLLALLSAVWSHVSREILWSDVLVLPLYWVVTFAIALPISLPLAALSLLIRERFRAANWLYWIAAGGICGVVAASIITYFVHLIDPVAMDDGTDVPFGLMWLKIAPAGLPSGALSGFVFWRVREKEW